MSGTHKHKCRNCGEIWEHPDTMRGNKAAHTCQSCGCEQWSRYYPSLDDPIIKIQREMVQELRRLIDNT